VYDVGDDAAVARRALARDYDGAVAFMPNFYDPNSGFFAWQFGGRAVTERLYPGPKKKTAAISR